MMWNICWDYVIYERGVERCSVVEEQGDLASNHVDNSRLCI